MSCTASVPLQSKSAGQTVSVAAVDGALVAGPAEALFRRRAAGLERGLWAGAVGGAVAGAASLNFGNADALKYGLMTAGIGGALAAAIMPGLHGMPVSPLAAGFEAALAGAFLIVNERSVLDG